MCIEKVCKLAKDNVNAVAFLSNDERNEMLDIIAQSLVDKTSEILKANEQDILASSTAPKHFIDRLRLDDNRIKGIANGLLELKGIDCPVGEVLDAFTTKDGLNIEKVRVPLGVIGIVYEARPNVTADVIGICLKSGNAVVLRGSKDAINSNIKIVEVIKTALKNKGYNSEFIQIITDTNRDSVLKFVKMNEYIDVIFPRGGAGLIKATVENATVPVIETGAGVCHTFVEKTADQDMAIEIIKNAKLQRPSVCNAMESLMVSREIANEFIPKLLDELESFEVKCYGDSDTCAFDKRIILASDDTYYREYLAYEFSIKVVDSVEEGIKRINTYGTKHSDAIITKDNEKAEKFLNEVDSSCVYVNASTRFTDGFMFGFGAEIGISIQKLHARGPMGLKELTSYKYKIVGQGQTRK